MPASGSRGTPEVGDRVAGPHGAVGQRNRRAGWSRSLVRETTLASSDLIWPIFLIEGSGLRTPVASMPGVERLSVDLAVKAAEEAKALGIPAIAVFPNTEPALRDEAASEAVRYGVLSAPGEEFSAAAEVTAAEAAAAVERLRALGR